MSNEWRRAVAALANPERRRVYASLVLGVAPDVAAPRLARALAALADAGLVTLTDEGSATLVDTAFADLLALEPEVRREGLDRFVVDGRITQYPAKAALRRELLEWVAGRIPSGDHTESALNELLAVFIDDFASLRRYLVDDALLERTPDGRSYRRPSA